eukprot:m.75884 g.75884  ORF g.75884 m.75884 type:complete len:173 (-) comp11859_c0_seq2:210-728(-)
MFCQRETTQLQGNERIQSQTICSFQINEGTPQSDNEEEDNKVFAVCFGVDLVLIGCGSHFNCGLLLCSDFFLFKEEEKVRKDKWEERFEVHLNSTLQPHPLTHKKRLYRVQQPQPQQQKQQQQKQNKHQHHLLLLLICKLRHKRHRHKRHHNSDHQVVEEAIFCHPLDRGRL